MNNRGRECRQSGRILTYLVRIQIICRLFVHPDYAHQFNASGRFLKEFEDDQKKAGL
jgi:hypothetical protein